MAIVAIPQTNRGDGDALSIPWLLLHCIGFGSCSAWVHVSFFSSVLFGASASMGLSAWVANIIANGVAMIVIGCIRTRTKTTLTQSPLFEAATVTFVLAGTLVSAFLQTSVPYVVWFAFGPVLTGIGTAGLLLLWAEAYKVIGSFSAKKYTLPGSMATGVLIYLLIVCLPSGMAAFALAGLPVLSLVCLKSTHCADAVADSCAKTSPVVEHSSQRRTIVRFMLVISVYCLASGYMSGRSTSFIDAQTSSAGTAMFGGIALLLIGITVASIVFTKPDQQDFAYRMIIPLTAAGLLLMPFVADAASCAANIAIMGGYIILEMFAWSTLQDVSKRSTEPAATVFGIGKAGMNLGLLVGCMLGMYASSQPTTIALGVSTVIVYAFILFGALVPSTRKTGLVPPLEIAKSMPAASSQAPAQAADCTAPVPTREDQCRTVAERFGLSQREEDVLNLLGYGRSLDAVADALGIAQSTARSHRDHIYRKLDVHNRQELLDLMEKEPQ